MPTIQVNGRPKKIACGPCIRGHRSTKCQHTDRVLLEVRKPGRPLTSCPHIAKACSCERLIINYTVPNKAECPCPSPASAATMHNQSPCRVQKSEPKRIQLGVYTGGDHITRTAVDKSVNLNSSRRRRTKSYDIQLDQPCPETADQLHTQSITFPETEASSTALLDCKAEQTSKMPLLRKMGERLNSKSCCESMESSKSLSACVGQAPDNQNHPALLANEATATLRSTKSAELESGSSLVSLKVWPFDDDRQERRYASITPRTASNCGPVSPYTLQPHPLAPISQSCCSKKIPQNMKKQESNLASTHYQPIPHTDRSSTHVLGTQHFLPPPLATNLFDCVSKSEANARAEPNSSAGNHRCTCGDACQCLGCAAHPANETTTEYVRETIKWMIADDVIEATSPIAPTTLQMMWTPADDLSGALAPSSQCLPGIPTWESMDLLSTSNKNSLGTEYDRSGMTSNYDTSNKVNEIDLLISGEADIEQGKHVNTESTDVGFNHTSLSPSDFSLQQFVIPSCSEITGACLCGDGCSCTGCMTHSGHNGISLSLSSNQSGNFAHTFDDFGLFGWSTERSLGSPVGG